MSVESIIYSKQLAHQYKLDAYTDAELAKINASLVKVQSEIAKDWNKMTDFSQARAYTLLDESRKITAGIKETISTGLAGTLGKVSAESAIAHSSILSFGGKAANVQSVMLNAEQMTSFWKTTPVGGSLLQDWVNKSFDKNTIDRIQKEIGAGLFKGEGYPALGKRLKEGFGMTKTEIDTLTRTYVQSANIDALKRVYLENKDFIKELEWTAAKLTSTCVVCLSLDGMTFPVEATPPCPQHCRCRCSLVPVTSFSKLGITKPDPKEYPGAIDLTQNGKQWMRGLDKKDLTKIIGPKRVDLLDKGIVKLTDLVDMSDLNNIRIPNLKQLTGEDLGLKKVALSKAEIEAAKAAEIAFDEMKSAQAIASSKSEVNQLISEIKAAKEAEAIAAQKAIIKAQFDAKVAIETAAKQEVMSQLEFAKEQYYTASGSNQLGYLEKELKVNLINELEAKANVFPSSIKDLEKVIADREYSQTQIAWFKKQYALSDDLEKQESLIKLINKHEAKLPNVTKSTFADLEAYTKEFKAIQLAEEAKIAEEVALAVKKAEQEVAKKIAAEEAAAVKKVALQEAAIKKAEEEALAAKVAAQKAEEQLAFTQYEIRQSEKFGALDLSRAAKIEAFAEAEKAAKVAAEEMAHKAEEAAALKKKLKAEYMKEYSAKKKAAKLALKDAEAAAIKAEHEAQISLKEYEHRKWDKVFSREQQVEDLLSAYETQELAAKEAKQLADDLEAAKVKAKKDAGKAAYAKSKAKKLAAKAAIDDLASGAIKATGTDYEVAQAAAKAADAEWAKIGKPENFTRIADKSVGGVHEKQFYVDSNGKEWMFKPAENKSWEFVVKGEESVYKASRLIDIDAVEVRVIELDGRLGSIQMMKSNLMADIDFSKFGVDGLTKLTASDLEQLQKEHVIDWLMSNHDTHAKQFIRLADGTVYGIDKGQAMKHLGKDVLNINYHPNGDYGERGPIYNNIFKLVKEGKISVDPNVTLRMIEKVEAIADKEFLAQFDPYVNGRFNTVAEREKFADLILARKQGIRKDFEAYYADVLNKPGFKFEASIEAKVEQSVINQKFVDEAKMLGHQGKTLPFDAGDIEDQNALVFTEKFNGVERTVVKMKVRPDAAERIDNILSKYVDIGSVQANAIPVLNEDVFFDKILNGLKTVNHHSTKSFEYNMGKLNSALGIKSELEVLAATTIDDNVFKMAKEYLLWIDKIEQAVLDKVGIKGHFQKFTPVAKVNDLTTTDRGFNVKVQNVMHTDRSSAGGEMVVKNDTVGNEHFFGAYIDKGVQYEIEFTDGTIIRYSPWDAKNMYAQQGSLEMTIPKGMTSDVIESSFSKLNDIGIDARISTTLDTEKMYLEKLAYVNGYDKDKDFIAVIKSMKKKPLEEQVTLLREISSQKIGVDDITRVHSYNPEGEYQIGFLDHNIKGGSRLQMRPDISNQDLEDRMKGYYLKHNITNAGGAGDLVDMIMNNNGAMISTVEKMRLGIRPGGMSPSADMETGGAGYFFTRITKPGNHDVSAGQLYFKKDMLRRMDSISYDHDAYGKVSGNYVKNKRLTGIDSWKNMSGYSSNETIFKGSVTLLDNIEYIIVDGLDEKVRVMETFSKRGITRTPDGRRIEDVVLTPGEWPTRKKI